MKNLFLIIICNIFCSLVSSENIFVVDSMPTNITSVSLFIYLFFDVQNLNVSDVLYLNYQNFLYQDNILTINGNITFNKLPLFKEGNYFLVLDSNNQLGIYDSLLKKKNLSYDTMTLNNIQSIDKAGIKISSTSGKNTLMKEINKFYAIGNNIYFDGIIKNTKTANIYSSDGISDISFDTQIATGDINCQGDNFYVDEINSKNFFSVGINITFLTNVDFRKDVLFNKNKNVAKFYFGNNSELLFKKNLLIKNIKDYGDTPSVINIVGLDQSNNLTYLATNMDQVKKSINIYPKENILSIGNNTYSLWFGGEGSSTGKLNDQVLNITNLTSSANIIINSGSSNFFYNANNVNITNVLPDGTNNSTYSFIGNGDIIIENLIIDRETHFQNKDDILILTADTSKSSSSKEFAPILVNSLDKIDFFDDKKKRLVIKDSSGLLAYSDNPKINLGKDEIMSDLELYNNLCYLYIQFGNKDLTLNNEIIEYIKERLRKKESNELLDKLFLYDEKSDDLLYNVVFAEELLTSKIMNIENQEISIQEEAEMERDIDQDLLNIKNAIFSILSEKHRKANL